MVPVVDGAGIGFGATLCRMARAVTVRGHLSDARHIELDQPVDTPRGPVEVVVRPVAEDKGDGASIVGLFADEPELMDEVSDSTMTARERDSLRTRGA
jgi:alpha-D-ribose 1-methylphosphonate 5-triphosphate synthase subunit PhnL